MWQSSNIWEQQIRSKLHAWRN